MKVNLPIWDVGFELEFFLASTDWKNSKPGVNVYNANRTMIERLGFSIDQNVPNAGKLVISQAETLRTDGTACEYQWFQNRNRGELPKGIERVLRKIKALDRLELIYCDYLKEGVSINGAHGLPTHFIDPQNIFASEKYLYDAYAGTRRVSDKKDDPKQKVTQRTAGLHFHFSVSDAVNYAIMNELGALFATNINGQSYPHLGQLVQIADRVYDSLYWNPYKPTLLRLEHYQKRGEYRVMSGDRTVTGRPTLEYRQLGSSMANNFAMLQRFIDTFQFLSKEYIEANL